MSDQSEDIAYSKASMKVRGPLMDTCSACGERYWPEEKADHLANDCFPPQVHLGDPIKPPAQPSAGEKWRTMKRSSLTPAERRQLGMVPLRQRGAKKPSTQKAKP